MRNQLLLTLGVGAQACACVVAIAVLSALWSQVLAFLLGFAATLVVLLLAGLLVRDIAHVLERLR